VKHQTPWAAARPVGDSCWPTTQSLRRWRARALAAAYLEYASLGPLPATWHLDLFEQPGDGGFSASC